MTGALGENSCLARASGGNDASRSAGVGHSSFLVGGKVARRLSGAEWREVSDGEIGRRDHRCADQLGIEPVQLSAVAPHGSVRSIDITGCISGDGGASGNGQIDGSDRGSFRVSCVDGMAEHQVTQKFTLEVSVGPKSPEI